MVVNPLFSNKEDEEWENVTLRDFERSRWIAMLLGLPVMLIGLLILKFS